MLKAAVNFAGFLFLGRMKMMSINRESEGLYCAANFFLTLSGAVV